MKPEQPGAGPAVSVAVLAYNHEAYIRQALDSILGQQTGFEYEVIIGEDCSTDSTRGIVQSYKKRFPDRIRLLLPEHNTGMCANFIATLAACRAPFIAFVDGDDYWTSDAKLQKQYDEMMKQPESVSGCVHRVTFVDKQGSGSELYPQEENRPRQLNMSDFLKGLLQIPSGSLFFRNIVERIPDGFLDGNAPDWLLKYFLLQQGDLVYLPEVMGAYRMHDAGIWNAMTETSRYESAIRQLRKAATIASSSEKQLIRAAVREEYIKIAHVQKNTGHPVRAWISELNAYRHKVGREVT